MNGPGQEGGRATNHVLQGKKKGQAQLNLSHNVKLPEP